VQYHGALRDGLLGDGIRYGAITRNLVRGCNSTQWGSIGQLQTIKTQPVRRGKGLQKTTSDFPVYSRHLESMHTMPVHNWAISDSRNAHTGSSIHSWSVAAGVENGLNNRLN